MGADDALTPEEFGEVLRKEVERKKLIRAGWMVHAGIFGRIHRLSEAAQRFQRPKRSDDDGMLRANMLWIEELEAALKEARGE